MLTPACWRTCSASFVRAQLRSGSLDHRVTGLLFRSTHTALGGLTQRAKEHQRGARTTTTCKRNSDSRPTLDDVERISRGQGAKARGTGSRRIPHRLNAEERQQYDIAKQKGFLTVKGTGYRKERKGSPLANTFRQWCDAQAKPCVVIEQGFGANAMDTVMVDVSTLRSADAAEDQATYVGSASSLGYAVSQQNHRIPFTIEAWQEFGITNTKDTASQATETASSGSSQDHSDQVQEGHSTEETADKSAVASSSHESQDSPPETTSADGKDDAAISESRSQSLPLSLGSRQQKRLASSSPLAPIWTVQAQPVFFDAERPQAKELAKAFVAIQE